jgi:hypothetical protein
MAEAQHMAQLVAQHAGAIETQRGREEGGIDDHLTSCRDCIREEGHSDEPPAGVDLPDAEERRLPPSDCSIIEMAQVLEVDPARGLPISRGDLHRLHHGLILGVAGEASLEHVVGQHQALLPTHYTTFSIDDTHQRLALFPAFSGTRSLAFGQIEGIGQQFAFVQAQVALDDVNRRHRRWLPGP